MSQEDVVHKMLEEAKASGRKVEVFNLWASAGNISKLMKTIGVGIGSTLARGFIKDAVDLDADLTEESEKARTGR